MDARKYWIPLALLALHRQGQSLTNFERSLAAPQSEFALHLQPKQPRCIANHHLIHLVFRHPNKVLLNLLLRLRKGALSMRIVRPPHQAIDANQFTGQNPGSVVFKRGPELALKIGAGCLVKLGLHPAVVIFPPVIHQA